VAQKKKKNRLSCIQWQIHFTEIGFVMVWGLNYGLRGNVFLDRANTHFVSLQISQSAWQLQ
jgi:hypothetical protein